MRAWACRQCAKDSLLVTSRLCAKSSTSIYRGVLERFIRTVLKTVDPKGSVSSNLTSSAICCSQVRGRCTARTGGSTPLIPGTAIGRGAVPKRLKSSAPYFMVRWQSGLSQDFAKVSISNGPRVRLPLSPPLYVDEHIAGWQ